MIPLYAKCYVENEGIGIVEAICNDSSTGGVSYSYCVRLKKSPKTLRWFGQSEVETYSGPDEVEIKPESNISSEWV